ncbi:hypothetical protein ABIA35_006978 [Catenulispora sp. MAP12-49]|uniref:hypothetical protein n=1 Tax=Catenulispora sp. MAP12-49 TaxID=3156302 RepID=UPI003515BBE6
MAEEFDHTDERLRTFIAAQPMYFVASAPVDGGHGQAAGAGGGSSAADCGHAVGGPVRLGTRRP